MKELEYLLELNRKAEFLLQFLLLIKAPKIFC